MITSKVAVRYSKALFDLAVERKSVDAVNEDMKLIAQACSDSKELTNILQSPIIKDYQKENVLSTIFKPHVNVLTHEFITMLSRQGRGGNVAAVANAYTDRYLEMKGIAKAVITTAFAMDTTMRSEVVSAIKKSIGSEVQLAEKVDKDLIGGFIIRVGDKQDDTSLKTKIATLRRAFKENPYVKEY